MSVVNYSSGVQVTTLKSSPAAAAAWACTVYSYNPEQSGSIITAYATNECSGSGYQPMQVCDTVQHLRWYGWQNMGKACSGYGYVSFDDVTASYNCSGTGTYQYNGAANSYVEAGAIETSEDDSLTQPQFIC